MDLLRDNRLMRTIAWFALLSGLLVGGCQLLIPKNSWNKKWGPVVPHTKFPSDCSLCHVPERWDKLKDDFTFDHEKETGYRLEGSHVAAACLRCHNDRGPIDAYVARGCAGCHLDPHTSSLGLDCEQCHSQISWAPTGLVGEHAATRFPLMGVHAIAACESCHEGAATGQFRGAPTQCEICHQADLTLATDPNHSANGWVADCQKCHQPTASWQGAFVNHDFFPLAGGHGGLDCTQCHTVPGIFSGLSTDCYSCHAPNYQTAPNHVAGNYSHNCEECHSTRAWSPATFKHSSFALTGAHTSLDCLQCHGGGVYAGLPSDCYSCHSANYQTAPNHVAGNYSMNCEQCHSTTAWLPAAFDHSSFALVGGHSGLDCTQCHVGGVYAGLPTDCYSCHATDYQGASDHASLNLSHDCEQCHTINGWTPSSFSHPFPLAGNHNVSCVTCHDAGSAQTFTCFNCHEHRQSEADDEHKEVSGYSYNSSACYNCHPNGKD